jgi:hypothetical protein
MLYHSMGGKDPGSVMLDEIGADRPLVRYLLDDPVYREFYRQELAAALQGAFTIDSVHARMDSCHALIAPYVVGADGESAPYTLLLNADEFETALVSGDNALKPHVEARHIAVEEALAH